jgi:hypothetical protein
LEKSAVDDELRQSLHDRLDHLLDQRSRIESPHPVNALGAMYAGVFPNAIEPKNRQRARSLFLESVRLARDTLGDGIIRAGLPRTYTVESEQRDLLRGWLRVFHPLLQPWPAVWAVEPDTKELSVFDVLDSLSALDAGEIRPIFAANKGKNRRANRWSLARTKLEALVWKKRLRALGYEEKAANYEITVAFGEQWDTIRKWKVQCEQTLGESHVSAALDYAGSDIDGYLRKTDGMLGGSSLNASFGLKTAGENYRNELRRSADLSKRKPSSREE